MGEERPIDTRFDKLAYVFVARAWCVTEKRSSKSN
jgi:hypothetical protein